MEDREEKPYPVLNWLLFAKATSMRSPHFWIILALLVVFAYIYYAVLTAAHDIFLILVFYPLIYAALTYRIRGVVITGIIILAILMPHYILVADEPYTLARAFLFAAFALIISGLMATLLNYLEKQLQSYERILALNRELNSYIEKLETAQRQLIQAEKLNAIGQLAASIAHEINNPLAGVLVYTKLLARELTAGSQNKEDSIENLNKIETAVKHCSYIIRSLLDFSRQSEPRLETVHLESVISDTITLVGHKAEMRRIDVNIGNMSVLPPVLADVKQLQQVFINLVINAIQATSEKGILTISGAVGDDGMVRVSVGDNGSGISTDDMERIFTPFFTTKESEKGVGLGLSVSLGIVERHGGRIEVESEPGRGSTFTVCLPQQQKKRRAG